MCITDNIGRPQSRQIPSSGRVNPGITSVNESNGLSAKSSQQNPNNSIAQVRPGIVRQPTMSAEGKIRIGRLLF